jgi:dolichol-phosphate mannosyltransferase
VLEELYERLARSLSAISPDYEIILVNDACPQGSWEVIRKLAEKDPKVLGIDFSRNFGQHYAITAGVDHAEGDWVVVMDGDLQDQPEEIEKMYRYALDHDFDVVFGRRHRRKDSLFKRTCSRLFFRVYGYFTESTFDNTVANFSIARRQVIQNFRKLREHNRSYNFFVRWMGFKTGFVDIAHAERTQGKSSYNLKKLLHLAGDNIVAHSNKPLHLSIVFGFGVALLSFLYAMHIILRYFLQGIKAPGWTSVIVSIWFIGGLMFANLGLLGLYIGKIFNETKNRPLYIIKQTVGGGRERQDRA